MLDRRIVNYTKTKFADRSFCNESGNNDYYFTIIMAEKMYVGIQILITHLTIYILLYHNTR